MGWWKEFFCLFVLACSLVCLFVFCFVLLSKGRLLSLIHHVCFWFGILGRLHIVLTGFDFGNFKLIFMGAVVS